MNIMATWFLGRSAAEVGGGVAVGFRHHGRGWCGTVAMMGMFNHFGHCLSKAVDSPELIKYEKSHKGEK